MLSVVGTVALPAAGTTNIGPIYTGDGDKPVRLAIRNNGGVTALLAYSSGAVNGAAGGTIGQTYQLPAGAEVIFILQPRQQVYGVGAGAGVNVSYHASVALPLGGLP